VGEALSIARDKPARARAIRQTPLRSLRQPLVRQNRGLCVLIRHDSAQDSSGVILLSWRTGRNILSPDLFKVQTNGNNVRNEFPGTIVPDSPARTEKYMIFANEGGLLGMKGNRLDPLRQCSPVFGVCSDSGKTQATNCCEDRRGSG